MLLHVDKHVLVEGVGFTEEAPEWDIGILTGQFGFQLG